MRRQHFKSNLIVIICSFHRHRRSGQYTRDYELSNILYGISAIRMVPEWVNIRRQQSDGANSHTELPVPPRLLEVKQWKIEVEAAGRHRGPPDS